MASKERNNPGEYLSVKGTYRKNLIGETVLEGNISNTATAAIFKDIVVKAQFLAPSGTVLSEENFTKYEILSPGRSASFKVKIFAPKQMQSVSMSVINAIPVE